jgi:mRNA interferase MazF
MKIVLLNIPKSGGKEQYGLRPGILLYEHSTQVIQIIPLTSNILSLKFKDTIRVLPSVENGLTSDSIALVFQLRALDKNRIVKQLGILEENYQKLIKNQLKKMFKL